MARNSTSRASTTVADTIPFKKMNHRGSQGRIHQTTIFLSVIFWNGIKILWEKYFQLNFTTEYLKRAHDAVLQGVNNPNTTLCKNTPADIAKEKLKERIIRGEDALLHEFPWQVSIQNQRGHVCGGAILNPRFILTAAVSEGCEGIGQIFLSTVSSLALLPFSGTH